MIVLIPGMGGMAGGPELLVILLIAVLLFGANKIPKLARSTGEAMGEFKKGREEVEQELNEMKGDTISSSSESGRAPSGEVESETADSESSDEFEADFE
ncbi:MAG: twin-arginine translocase TatA/TatE family subunit [Halococcoides sp.]